LLRTILSEVFAADLDAAPRGTDGCGIPVLAVPLHKLARGMARMAAPEAERPRRRDAMRRIRAAMAAHPFLVAGTHRFATRIIEVGREKALVKGGAEGVFCGILCHPGGDSGLGVALKIDDGANRAAEVAIGALLRRFKAIDEAQAHRIAEVLVPKIHSWAGREVGRVTPTHVLRD
jgi:L-asparaginase II